jgi:hypothetical protein
MHYKIRNTEHNVELLYETAKECHFACWITVGEDFVVCNDCISYPAGQVGLQNALVSDCKEATEGLCVICNSEPNMGYKYEQD